ncbi:MAG: hypothetical protein NTY12_01625 [Candidatus Falkowbacteria bacterium]|nr:hypothetical protein [Candidatus Falkowbacteria bacterium]
MGQNNPYVCWTIITTIIGPAVALLVAVFFLILDSRNKYEKNKRLEADNQVLKTEIKLNETKAQEKIEEYSKTSSSVFLFHTELMNSTKVEEVFIITRNLCVNLIKSDYYYKCKANLDWFLKVSDYLENTLYLFYVKIALKSVNSVIQSHNLAEMAKLVCSKYKDDYMLLNVVKVVAKVFASLTHEEKVNAYIEIVKRHITELHIVNNDDMIFFLVSIKSDASANKKFCDSFKKMMDNITDREKDLALNNFLELAYSLACGNLEVEQKT